MKKNLVKKHQDLAIYKIAFNAAMEIFELSKKFPLEEKFSLTDQMRRSSRSLCANRLWRFANAKRCRIGVANRLKHGKKEDIKQHSLLNLVTAKPKQQKLRHGLNLLLNADI